MGGLLLLLLASAITLGGGLPTAMAGLPDVTQPTPSRNDLQTLVADALERTAIAEGGRRADRDSAGTDTLNLQVESRCRGIKYLLSSGALPHADRIKFRLLTRDEIVAATCLTGHLDHLDAEVLRVSAREATVEIRVIHLECAQGPDSAAGLEDNLARSATGYIYKYRKDDGTWSVVKKDIILID